MLPVNKFGGSRVANPPPNTSRYAVGKRAYGAGRPMPNIGPVAHPQGYKERDNKHRAQRNALLRRLKGQQTGNPMNRDVLINYLKGGFS